MTFAALLTVALLAQTPLPPPLPPGSEPADANRITGALRATLITEADLHSHEQRNLTDAGRREWIARRLTGLTQSLFGGLPLTTAEVADIGAISARAASTRDWSAKLTSSVASSRASGPPPAPARAALAPTAAPVAIVPAYYRYAAPNPYGSPLYAAPACVGGNCAAGMR